MDVIVRRCASSTCIAKASYQLSGLWPSSITIETREKTSKLFLSANTRSQFKYNHSLKEMHTGSSKVSQILRNTFNRLETSEPQGICRIFCDLLKYFTDQPLNSSDQVSLSLSLLEKGMLDIVLDLLATDSIDLADYVNLLTLTLALLIIPKQPDLIQTKYNISDTKLKKIVDSLFTAAHNAFNVVLSKTADKRYELYALICQCLRHLKVLASSFRVVRLIVISSPSFLHLLVKDDGSVTIPILSSLFSILKMSINKLNVLKSSFVFAILDELVLKLGQKDTKIALLSLQSIHIILFNCSQLQPDRLSKRYKGVSHVLKRWQGNDFDEVLEEVLLRLDPNIRFEDERHAAARVIQAHWRGYYERNRLIHLKKVALHLQSRIRFKTWFAVFNRRCEKAKLLKNLKRSDQIRDSSIRRQTEVFETIQNLPASEIRGFINRQQELAAITIQCSWRCLKSKQELKQLKKERFTLENNVICIQRAFRKYLMKKQKAKQSYSNVELNSGFQFRVDEEMKKWRESYKPERIPSEKELQQSWKELEQSLKEHYAGMEERLERFNDCDNLLKSMQRSCDLLLNAPKLCEVTKADLERFSVHESRTDIIAKARKAHKDRLARHKKLLLEHDSN